METEVLYDMHDEYYKTNFIENWEYNYDVVDTMPLAG